VSHAETVVSGVGLLEGPVWRPASGDLTVTVVGAGKIMRVDLDRGLVDELADTMGGPNGAHPCTDGGLLVTQNGGLDWDAIGIHNPAPSRPTTPGIQHVAASGEVRLLTEGEGPFRAPNDLCVTAGGTIWFTDPPQFPPPAEAVGRVWRWEPGSHPEVYAGGFKYCNGIGVDSRGAVVVVEQAGLLYVQPDGTRQWLVEVLPSGGDGFKFDLDGNIYVCGGRHVTVVSPDGRVAEQLEVPPGDAMVTNCCFGGPDMRTLFATDGGSGRVVAWQSMPVPGVELVPVAVP
jgi:gluconolactonase